MSIERNVETVQTVLDGHVGMEEARDSATTALKGILDETAQQRAEHERLRERLAEFASRLANCEQLAQLNVELRKRAVAAEVEVERLRLL